MRKVAYWHVYLPDEEGVWTSIVLEQLTLMEKSGLLNELDSFRPTVIAKNDGRSDKFRKILFPFFKPSIVSITDVDSPWEHDYEMVQNLNNPANKTEEETLSLIWQDANDAQEDTAMLYFHTKGITSHIRHLGQNLINDYLKTYYWRQYLNWGVLKEWKWNIARLKEFGNDVSGPNLEKEPRIHYSGNFWWANSSYIKLLPDPKSLQWWDNIQAASTNDWIRTCPARFKDEMWVTSGHGSFYGMYSHLSLPNPAHKLVLPSEYES